MSTSPRSPAQLGGTKSARGSTNGHDHRHPGHRARDRAARSGELMPDAGGRPARAAGNETLQTERRRAADELLQQNYEQLKPKVREDVRCNLRGRGLELKFIDFDGCYNAAWFGLHQKVVNGEDVGSLMGWLVNGTVWAALDETEQAVGRAEVSTEVVQPERADAHADFAETHLSRSVIRNWITGLRTRLSEREQQAAALHVLHGYTRDEIATMLGVERIRVDKILNAVYHKTRPLLQSLSDGTFCEEQRSLMTAYACGVLDPEGERYAIARRHILECPGCAALVRAQRGLCALIPAPMLVTTLAASGGGGLLGAILGFFKGSGAGAASTGVTSAGAGTTGGMIAFGGAAKVVVPVVCALCVGGALELGGSPDAKPAPPPAAALKHQQPQPQATLSVPTITTAPQRAHVPAPTPRARQTRSTAHTTTTKQPAASPQGSGGEFSIERSAAAAPAPAPTTSSATTSPPTSTAAPKPAPSQGGEFGIER